MDLNALNDLSYGLYVVSVPGGQGGFGGCIVDALMQATSDEPPVLLLSSIKRNFTNQALRETGEFAVSVLPKAVDPLVIAQFGFQSSKNVDKWADVKHDMFLGLPVLPGCTVIRGRVTEQKELSTHTLFTCTTLDVVKGKGLEPLTYAFYRNELKNEVFAAFKAYKAQKAGQA